jgi:hypothetical protein
LTKDWGRPIVRFIPWIQLTTLGAIALRFARTGGRSFGGVRASGALILAYMITGKVLSPQFLVWIVPFVAVLEGPSARAAKLTFLTACFTTTLIYPLGGLQFVYDRRIEGVLLLNIRNALLILLLALFWKGDDADGDRRPD